MTPEQCKAARVLLCWSRADLAEAADLPELVVEMFEADKLVGLPSCEIAMQDVMTAAGIGFSDLSYEARRSLDSCPVLYAPRDALCDTSAQTPAAADNPARRPRRDRAPPLRKRLWGLAQYD